MITHVEQDPDVVQWGLQFFQSDPYSNYAYCDTTTTQDNVDHYDGEQHFKGDNYDNTECFNVEDDELFAHALQEELSQLAVTEVPESPQEENEHLQMPVFQQDWLGQSMENDSSGRCYINDAILNCLISWEGLCGFMYIVLILFIICRAGAGGWPGRGR